MNPTSDQALRTALDHETTSIVRQLQADNERLRNELATAKANLGNRYLRSVLNLIAKHRDMGVGGGIHVIDERLVLHDDGLHMDAAMVEQLYQIPLEDKLAIIPVLCGLGYWVVHESNIDTPFRQITFTVLWDQTEEQLHNVCDKYVPRGGILHRPTE
jgi:hypothetical protein